MKKAVIFTIILLAFFIIVSASVIVFGNPDFLKELPQRLAPYHNTGDITVTLDGKK